MDRHWTKLTFVCWWHAYHAKFHRKQQGCQQLNLKIQDSRSTGMLDAKGTEPNAEVELCRYTRTHGYTRSQPIPVGMGRVGYVFYRYGRVQVQQV